VHCPKCRSTPVEGDLSALPRPRRAPELPPLPISHVSTRSRRYTALSPHAPDGHRARYSGSCLDAGFLAVWRRHHLPRGRLCYGASAHHRFADDPLDYRNQDDQDWFLVPFGRPFAADAGDFGNAAQMVADELNGAGGICGAGSRYKFDLVKADTESQRSDAVVTGFRRLNADNDLNFIMAPYASTSNFRSI
jgi:hypothetical protein